MKRTEEETREVVENLGYNYISSYFAKKHQRKVIIQDREGYKYDVYLSNILKGQNINMSDKSNPFTLSHNIPLWLKLNDSQFKLLEDNEYIKNNSKLNLYCKICKDYPKMSWANISQGFGCGICDGKQVGLYHNLATQRPDIASEWHPIKNGNLTPKDVTYASHKKVWWICSEGHEYYSEIAGRTSGRGCKKCNQSKGEKKIYDFLLENKVNFKEEFPLVDCKYKRKLWLDFYLIDFYLAIEYDGYQHFHPVNFSGKNTSWSKKNLKKIKERDEIKTKYCKDNNINLLRIPYWEFDNIENILEKTLSELR